MNKSIFLLALLLALPVQAEQSITITRSIFTTHIGVDIPVNENNMLRGVEYRHNDWMVNTSTFINSYDDRTYTAGLGYNLVDFRFIEFDALFGVAYGYYKPVYLPYLVPRLTFKYDLTDSLAVKTSVQVFGQAVMGTVSLEYKF
jgi:hypothetical protein